MDALGRQRRLWLLSLSCYLRSMSGFVSLALSLAEELVGQREFGMELEEAASGLRGVPGKGS